MALAAAQTLMAITPPQAPLYLPPGGEESRLPYLTFETTDGAKVSVATEALTLTINGTTLTAGQQTFNLTSLAKMYFSDTDETAGIDDAERRTQNARRSTFIFQRSTSIAQHPTR